MNKEYSLYLESFDLSVPKGFGHPVFTFAPPDHSDVCEISDDECQFSSEGSSVRETDPDDYLNRVVDVIMLAECLTELAERYASNRITPHRLSLCCSLIAGGYDFPDDSGPYSVERLIREADLRNRRIEPFIRERFTIEESVEYVNRHSLSLLDGADYLLNESLLSGLDPERSRSIIMKAEFLSMRLFMLDHTPTEEITALCSEWISRGNRFYSNPLRLKFEDGFSMSIYDYICLYNRLIEASKRSLGICFPVSNETSRYSIGPRERLIIIDNLYEYDRFKELNYVTDEENTACLEWILKCNSFSKNDLHVASDDGTDINFIYGLRIQKDLISRYKMILEGSDDK